MATGGQVVGVLALLEGLLETRFIVCIRDRAERVAWFKAAGGGSRRPSIRYALNRELNRALVATTTTQRSGEVSCSSTCTGGSSSPGEARRARRRYERWFEDRAELIGDISRFLGNDVTRGKSRSRDRGRSTRSRGTTETSLQGTVRLQPSSDTASADVVLCNSDAAIQAFSLLGNLL